MDRIRNLGFLLKDVSRQWVRYFEQQAKRHGLTLTDAKVLVVLSRNEGTTQARLAELCDTDPMTLVRVLDRMEKDDLLERRPDPNDRRAYRLYLRPASDSALTEINRIGDKIRGEVLNGLSTEERSHLVALLERIQGNLQTLLPAAATNETPAPLASAVRRRKASS